MKEGQVAPLPPTYEVLRDLGVVLGQTQAFGMVAGRSTAAQALGLKRWRASPWKTASSSRALTAKKNDIITAAVFGSSRRSQKMPAGLGHHHAGTQSGMAGRAQRHLSSIWQDIRANFQ